MVGMSCGDAHKEALFELKENTGINFRNDVEDGKLDNSFLFRNFYNGGGVAIGDINNDGWSDVLLSSNMGENKLYLNKGRPINGQAGFSFEDITAKTGFRQDSMWSTGVVMADINADGWLDIYVCNSGHMRSGNRRNKLYINNHDLSFTESAAKYGLDISAYTTQASFFDYDMDGDLDCFIINNSPIPINQLNFANQRDLPDSAWNIAGFLKGGGDHLYKNENGVFREVTREAGIHGGLISFGLGASVGDINNDGWPDVFVSNDSYEKDYLYINQKNGTFKDELEDWFQHSSFSSMGADIADINNDGYPDLFSTDMLAENDYRLKTTGSFDNISLFNSKLKSGFYYQYTKNCLQLNNQNGKFIDIARYSGVAATDWSWGALMFDMDNDGWNDLLVCNGVNRDVTNLDFMDFFANEVMQKMVMTGKKDEIDKVLKEIPQISIPNKVYRNEHNLHFTDTGNEWGMGQPTFSNGAAYGDLDNDGDLDLIINNENQLCSVYQNNSREINRNNYLGIVLKGRGQNIFAIGSKVQLFVADETLTRELMPSRGFQSSVDYKLIFGLGKREKVDSMVVTWPNLTTNTFINPSINKLDTIMMGEESAFPFIDKPGEAEPVFFTKEETAFDKHIENEYVDFYTETGIPRVVSREGPKAAVADINGDGLEDVFIGGATGTSGQLYVQTATGRFVKKSEKAFLPFFDFEDVAVLFFDCDKDGDKDLLICPGGNTSTLNSRELQLRLFVNDGKGNFTLDISAFPTMGMNISVAIANDFNGDGFNDLFVGARSFPGVYGKDPQSYLFVNDGKGHFTDIAKTKNPGIAFAGMITGAAWDDITGDAQKELIIAGEWMSPRIFSYNGDHFVELKTNLSDKYGWWQTMITADINGDGRKDLILGNIGENFYLRPDSTHPVKLWMNDFDRNGDVDKILSYTVNGKDMPVFLKHDLEEQIPVIKKSNLRHEDYALKSIQELFPKEWIDGCTVKKFNYAPSCVAINHGNGQFTIQELPPMVQLSCINAIMPMDVNGDGYVDLVTGGNQFGFLPQFEKLDASFGDILINDGKGNLNWQSAVQTGLGLRGELRDIAMIKNARGIHLLFLQNNEYPVLYTMNPIHTGK
ncbi:MAG TPA: VCBS repeat-containing protein [Agriterribacter sp.]|nr:VCBS repeat-containing protein [Agriterribacter sp.]